MIEEAKVILASLEQRDKASRDRSISNADTATALLRQSPSHSPVHSSAQLAGPGFRSNPLLVRTSSSQQNVVSMNGATSASSSPEKLIRTFSFDQNNNK